VCIVRSWEWRHIALGMYGTASTSRYIKDFAAMSWTRNCIVAVGVGKPVGATGSSMERSTGDALA
jgi:hypothetical protein